MFRRYDKLLLFFNNEIFLRCFILVIKVSFLFVVIWFVGRALYNSILQVNWSILTIKPLQIIVGALILFSSNIFGSWIQRTFYRKLGFILSWAQGFALYGTPQLAKYLPGKLWSIIGYSGIAKWFSIPVMVSSSATFVISGWGLAGASLLGAILVLLNPPMFVDKELLHTAVPVVTLILIFLFLYPKLYLRIVNFFLIFLKQPPIRLHYHWRTMMEIVGGSFILNSLYFLGLALIILSIVEVPFSLLPILVGIFCLANVVGFLALFAPAGIGVREGILLLVLGTIVGSGVASVIAILARLIQTVADIFSTVFGLMSFYFGRKGNTS